MVQTNKILTVSYGTFSCTLEGFDDSFSTMKAIATYFHDLAAEDRYFGAEPPQPDAELLARIAQREISRRVEARQEPDGIVLRAEQATAAPESLPATRVQHSPEVSASAKIASAPPPERDEPSCDAPLTGEPEPHDRVLETFNDRADTCEGAVFDADRGEPSGEADWPATDLVAELMPEPSDRMAAAQDSITVKLQRIRAVVTRNRLAEQTGDFTEDEHAEAMFTTTDAGLAEALGDTGDEAPDPHVYREDRGFDTAGEADEPVPDDAPDPDVVETDSEGKLREAEPPRATEIPLAGESAAIADLRARDEDDPAVSMSETAPDDETGAEVEAAGCDAEEAAADEALPETDPEDGVAAETACFTSKRVTGIGAGGATTSDAATTGEPVEPEDEAQAAPDAETEPGSDARHAGQVAVEDDMGRGDASGMAEVETREPQRRPRVLRVDRAAIADAIASGVIQSSAISDPEDSEPRAKTGDEEAPDDALIRSLLGTATASSACPPAEPDPVGDMPADREPAPGPEPEIEATGAIMPESEDPGTPDKPLLLVNRCVEDAELPVPLSEAGTRLTMDDPRSESGAHSPSEGIAEAAPCGIEDQENSDTDTKSESAATGRNDSDPETADTGAGDTADSVAGSDHRDADTTRLMAVAQDIMNDPDSASSRDMHSRMRSAATAVHVDRIGTADAEDDDEIYRRDLASFVRPRRPVATARGADRPVSTERPAPLKLAEDLRIDDHETARPKGPIRPRRIRSSSEYDSDEPRNDAADTDFVKFAETMGATELPDLLEAAAAYLSFVEGRAQFSRPQLMKRARLVENDSFNREDGLRSFGLLLRAGKIEKAGSGRFTVSDDTSFRPGSHLN